MEEKELKDIVDKIVIEWNSLVVNVQNNTIQLCLMIDNILKDHPKSTVKEVMARVKKHPNIKQFVSIDRIWQGLRLVHSRKDILEYAEKPEVDKLQVDFKNKPYLKKDGDIFWEFYFELEKTPFTPLEREMLEVEAKNELWSLRQLKDAIQKKKDELLVVGNLETARREKEILVKKCCAIIRELPLNKLGVASNYLEDLKKGE